jgi:oxygen-dependent protoporphyrinogen oxidase
LPERLAEALDGKVKYGAKVQSLTGCADGVTRSGWQVGLGNGENLGASQVVLAVPTHAGATLLENAAPAVASELRAIEYAPMFLVSSAYRRASVEHPLDGFGFMVPRQEGLNTICTFWNSSLFPQRAPDDTVLMTTFARVVLDGDAGSTESKLAASVEAENAKILGIKDKSIDRVVWRDAQALPQYNVGHAVRVERIFETLKTVPRLHLAGNYLTGRSIGDCVDNGFRVAAEVYSQVASKHIQ